MGDNHGLVEKAIIECTSNRLEQPMGQEFIKYSQSRVETRAPGKPLPYVLLYCQCQLQILCPLQYSTSSIEL